jgi:hypothetical protein
LNAFATQAHDQILDALAKRALIGAPLAAAFHFGDSSR